jgi:DNA-binding NtrC family response regulator
MAKTEYISDRQRNALIVHPDLGVLSAMQAVVSQEGFTPILCRDLPTALLAIVQHRFDLCIVSARIAEQADGWSLAGVLHMCFPHAFIAMIAPEPDLLMLQTAINSGVTQLYLSSRPPAELAIEIARDCNGRGRPGKLQ